MFLNGLVGLLSRFKSAGSDDRNAVIEGSGVFGKTKSSYQMLGSKGVDSNIFISCSDTEDFAVHVSESTSINSLTKLIISRLGMIRFLANGEMGDLDHQQLMEQFNEIDNQVEKLENELDQHSRGIRSVYKKEQQKKANNLLKKSVFDDYDDIT